MCTESPGSPLAIFFRLSAISGALFQPSLPRLSGTIVCSALPSADGIGPVTLPSSCLKVPNCLASAAPLARSAAVRPDGRSYTMTPNSVFGDWNAPCRLRAWVDSALPGSHEEASLFSALLSLPASDPAKATTISQNTRTRNLVRRPVSSPAKDRVIRGSQIRSRVARYATYLIVNTANGQIT